MPVAEIKNINLPWRYLFLKIAERRLEKGHILNLQIVITGEGGVEGGLKIPAMDHLAGET